MADSISCDFKFSIGDLVISKAARVMKESHRGLGESIVPKVAVVIAQMVERCPGGTQKYYTIGYGNGSNTVHEIELELFEAQDKQPQTKPADGYEEGE